MKNSPAFPIPRDFEDVGLSKREYFAAMALQGILANTATEIPKCFVKEDDPGMFVTQLIVREAVEMADALILELGK